MKRQTAPKDVLVYRFGVHRTADPGEVADQQLRLAHRLWCDLVWIDRRYEQSSEDCYDTVADVAAARAAVAAAEAAAGDAVKDAQAAKARARSPQAPAAEAAAVAEARAAQRQALKALKAAKREAKPVVQPLLDEMAFARRLQIEGDKAGRDEWRAATGKKRGSPDELGSPLYRRYVADGLFYGSYSDVLQRYDVARRRVSKDRAAWAPGRPWPRLRTGPYDGTGTLCAPLMAQRGKPQDVDAIEAGRWAGVVEIGESWPHERTGRRASTVVRPVHITCGAGRRITLPVIFHRSLPPGWDVKLVRATRTATAGRAEWSVQFTLVRPEQPRRDGRNVVAVNVGWRSLGEGRYRVGAISATFRLPDPPAHLAGWTDGQTITVPAEVRGALVQCDQLRSLRDDLHNQALATAVGWFRSHPDAAARLGVNAADMARWRSPGRLASLVIRWRDDLPAAEAAVHAQLEGWRRRDKHLWTWQENQRRQAIARRNDGYRKVAAWLGSLCDVLIVGSMDLAELARRPDGITEEAWDEQARAAAAARQAMAPSELRHALVTGGHGATVRVTDDARMTMVHHVCGTDMVAAGEDPRPRITMRCPTCRCDVDQDVNHAEGLVLAASGEAGA